MDHTQNGTDHETIGTTTALDQIPLLAGIDMWHTPAVGDVPSIRMSDGPAGVRGTDWNGPESASFPCGTALAATFDPDLVREVGRALGREARSKSAQVLLAPTVNLHRTPIGGRNFECMSEDPVHTASIAVAYVEGVQAEGVACCIKHFVGNDTEFARFVVSSEIPERLLREVYLVPFEAAVGAGVRSIMTGYNRLNGTFCSEHSWLLETVLRGDWGFDGVVVSDWYGTHSTVDALLAGLDVEMPGPPRHRGPALVAALEQGEIDRGELEAAIGRSAERIRALAEWTGAAGAPTTEATADDPLTRAVSRRAAAAAAVLLKNDLLPNTDPASPGVTALPLRAGARVALIGPYADTGRVQGGGSAKVRPHRPSPLMPALRRHEFVVEHAPGCHIPKSLPVMRGTFEFHLADSHGNSVDYQRSRLEMIRQHHELDGLVGSISARITGTFRVDSTGDWNIGLRSVGTSSLSVDGHEVIAVPEGVPGGGSFFGFGSDEMIGTVALVEGVDHHIEVQYPSQPLHGMCGVIAGARSVATADLIADAVALAAAAEVAVVVVGTNDEWETEGEDRTSLHLPGRQDELVEAVVAANPNTVVLVNSGSPVAMPWLDRVPAVMQMWFPGGELGVAMADVLSGDVEPGGRLPVTFPRRLDDTPAFEHHRGDGVRAEYAEGSLIGHRWYADRGIDPLFWFGHGLGYTTFALLDPRVEGDLTGGGEVRVAVDVRNTGGRPGSEVVQVYVRYRGEHPDVRPELRFAGSQKLFVVPDTQISATVAVPRRSFASWLDGAWHIPPGDHEVLIGRSAGTLTPLARLTAP